MIDNVDRKILDILQQDASISSAEIARQVRMVPSAVCERLRKLREKEIIKGYEVRLDATKLERPLLAYVAVRTNETAAAGDTGIELARIPEIQEVYNVAGEDCYLIKVRTHDTVELGRLLRDKIGVIPTVISTRTTIVLETYKETNMLPIEVDAETSSTASKP